MATEADAVLEVDAGTGTGLKLRVAGLGARSLAFVADLHVRALLAGAWFVGAGMAVAARLDPVFRPADDGLRYAWLVAIPSTAIWVLYHPVLEVAMRGRTPGKRWAGLRIVARDGRPAGTGALLVRNVLRLVDMLPFLYGAGILSCVVTREQVRIGDLAAGTVLVYERQAPRADAFERAGSSIPSGELAADLAARWRSLSPASRQALARRLLASAGVPDAGEADDSALREAVERLRDG
jgi:uncharacterized RDD family membrane protein YckC